MKLTLNQAANRLGKTRRQIVYMINNERLPAEKVGGRWFIDDTDLPLSENQRESYQRKQRQLQSAVSDALEVDKEVQRRYSLGDLKAFQIAQPLYHKMTETLGAESPPAIQFRRSIECLSMGCHRFEYKDKAAAYREARDAASLTVCQLALADLTAHTALIDGIEQDFMACLAGLLRRLDKKRN